MRSPTNKTDRRTAERRHDSQPSLPVATAKGERRVVEQRDMGTAMSDALEDILKWERASERALRLAAVAPESAETTHEDAARSN